MSRNNNAGPQQDVFKKVHLSEKKMIFREMAFEHTMILVKNDQDEFAHFNSFRLDDDSKLYCARLADSPGITTEQAVVLNFIFKGESYFIQSYVTFENGIPCLDIEGSLYVLQRRNNARIVLPDEYPAFVNWVEYNSKAVFYEGRVQDISAGGCRIMIPGESIDLKIGDKIKVVLHLGQRRPVQQLSEVRFVKKDDSGQTFGIQFQEVDRVVENRLLTTMMDIQRELYVKYGPK